jgi:hypothetical protein
MSSAEQSTRDLFFFNGVDGCTGEYLFPPMSPGEILPAFKKLPPSQEKALVPGVDPKNLSEAGWGVIFHKDEDPAIYEALAPLLKLRKAQATGRFEHLYREFRGEDGYGKMELKEDFLTSRGASLGPVHPHRMPYYLLIVGSPARIPFWFQHQLDVQYAVGRICFDTPEEYERYARSVVAAETGGVRREKRVSFFGVSNADDSATNLSAEKLVAPLAKAVESPSDWMDVSDWTVERSLAGKATKARMARLIHEENPALIFTASHGMGFSCGAPLQRAHQGALLCQDWPGPRQWEGAVPPDLYFSGDDVGPEAQVAGLVAFHFACHGAGTPAVDNFSHLYNGNKSKILAPEPFVSRLPQRLLAHPKGGALAVIGHVERAWGYSFLTKTSNSQITVFDSTLRLLMDGYPVGFAMEYFNQLYGELAGDLALLLQRCGYEGKFDKDEIDGFWTAANDARNYAVVGDPAVRVVVG